MNDGINKMDLPEKYMGLSAIEVGSVFGISKQAIGQWVKLGCPKGKDGFNVADVVQWKLAYAVGQAEAEAIGPDGKFTEHQLRKQKADADAAEFRFAVMKKQFYPTPLIDQWFFGLASGVKSKLVNVSNVIAPDLYGREIEDIEERIRDVLENIIRELHNASKPDSEVTTNEDENA